MKNSQKICIKNHLILTGKIDPLYALNTFGCFRLAARISDLRDEGMKIETDISKGHAVYKYTPDPQLILAL